MHQLKWILLIVLMALFFQNCSESSLNFPTNQQEVKADSLEIVTQPQSQSVPLNQTVELSVEVNDETDITYQWYFGDIELPGEVGPTLTIPNLRLGDIGEYYVVIKRKGQPELTSQPGSVTVTSPVAGNLTLAIGTGGQGTGTGNIVLAECAAGETKLGNVTVQNIPNNDQNEGAPGFVDFALCEKNGVLGGTVKLGLANCDGGFASVTSATYQNVSTNDFGNGAAPDNPVIHVCDQSGITNGNIALMTGPSCPAGLGQLSAVSFRNTGNFENGSAPLNVTMLLCGK